jgi:hypothetical protein
MHRSSRVRNLASVLVLAVLSVVLTGTRAEAVTDVDSVPFNTVVDACGETVSISGNLRIIFTVQQQGDRGFLIATHFQPQGIKGTSASGALYRANGLTRDITVFSPAGGSTSTFINRFHLVGTAGAPTYLVKQTVHVTVNAAGDVTAVVDRSSVTCR